MNFENAVIYKLVCKDPEILDTYVGSTMNYTKRKYMHKHHCTNEQAENHHLYVYKFIRDHGGWDNWQMLEICKASECTTKQELCRLERRYLEELKATLNKVVPTRTDHEYYVDNIEKHKERCKQYEEENKEKLNEYRKEYYQKTKEAKKPYRKQYNEENREHLAEYRKKYRLENSDDIAAKKKAHYAENKDKIRLKQKEYRERKKAEKASNNQTQ